MTNIFRSSTRRYVDIVRQTLTSAFMTVKTQTVKIKVIRHPFYQNIFFMLKKPAHHCVTRRRLQRKNRLPVFRPAINTDARMPGFVFGYRTNAVYMLTIYQKR